MISSTDRAQHAVGRAEGHVVVVDDALARRAPGLRRRLPALLDGRLHSTRGISPVLCVQIHGSKSNTSCLTIFSPQFRAHDFMDGDCQPLETLIRHPSLLGNPAAALQKSVLHHQWPFMATITSCSEP